jgi:hypothetical protein
LPNGFLLQIESVTDLCIIFHRDHVLYPP